MTARTAAACPLTVIAWRLRALPLTDLWWRYVGLGGDHPRGELAAYLDGTASWPDPEHNVLAQTLNEGLWESGCPSLAPLRDHEHDLSGVAARTRHDSGTPPDRRG